MTHRLVALLGSLAVPTCAMAQGFPSKPIRIIAIATVGGGVDSSFGVVAQGFQELLGQPGVVENRPGAGGAVDGDIVAKAHALLAISIMEDLK